MSIDEVNELLDAELPEGDWDTVGGLVYSLLGHVPTEGETVESRRTPAAGRTGAGTAHRRVRIAVRCATGSRRVPPASTTTRSIAPSIGRHGTERRS